MIIDYKLTYPSGTATAVLINGFHTSKGDKTAKYVVIYMFLMNLVFFLTCSWIELDMYIDIFVVFETGNRFAGL